MAAVILAAPGVVTLASAETNPPAKRVAIGTKSCLVENGCRAGVEVPGGAAGTLRFNIGGADVVDHHGNRWTGVTCDGGEAYTSRNAIDGTVDDALFQSRQFEPNCKLPVPAGSYTVTAGWAETYNATLDYRVFTLAIEGKARAIVDVGAAAGKNRTLLTDFEVDVKGATLDVKAKKRENRPMLALVMVTPRGSSGDTPATSTAPSTTLERPTTAAPTPPAPTTAAPTTTAAKPTTTTTTAKPPVTLPTTTTAPTATAPTTTAAPTTTTAPPTGRVYPWHTNIVATTFWVGELFDATLADGSQVCSTYDAQWAFHWSGINRGTVPNSAPGCGGSIWGGCDGVTVGEQCRTERRTAANDYFPTQATPLENPFYLDLPFDDLNDSTGFSTRCSVIPWAGDPGYAGHCSDQNFSYMKNRWVKLVGPSGATCYGQIEDAGPSHGNLYHDAAYVFGGSDARPVQTQFNNAGMDVSPALNGCLGFAALDGDNDRVSWQFVDAVDVPAGPWKRIVTTSGVTN